MSASAASMHVLLAVDSPALRRVIEHLLEEVPGIEVARARGAEVLSRSLAAPSPDVIVTSARMMGKGSALSAAALRRACPRSRLIVITADREWWRDEVGPHGADASFDEVDVVRCLLPIVQILAAGTTFPVAAD